MAGDDYDRYAEGDEKQRLLVNNANPNDPEISTVHLGPKRTATFFSSCVNLSNTILGAGMLGLPYALSECGYILGSAFLILSALASSFGLYLLVQCSGHCKTTPSYYNCAKETFPFFAFIIDLVVLVKCFGVAISYLIVIGDLMPDVMQNLFDAPEGSVLLSRQLWVGIFGACIIPLAFLKQLNSLRFTSLLALGTVCYLLGLVVAFFFLEEADPIGVEPAFFDTGIFSVLTIFVFGFTCHQNIFSIYNELIDPTPRRINGVIFVSVGICLGVYFIVALLGYFTYGNVVEDNIINNYPVDDISVTIGRIFISILVAFSYPLQTHPSRICLDNLYRVVVGEWMKKEVGPQTTARYLVETGFLVVGTFVIGLTVSDLAVMLALVGATGSTTMCYILPGLFYLKMEKNSPWSLTKLFAAILSITGVFIMPTAIVFIFLDV